MGRRKSGPDSSAGDHRIGNEPSMRLAERLGFVRQPDAIYRGEPIAIFRRPARQG